MEFDETSMLGEQLYEALAMLDEIPKVTEEQIDEIRHTIFVMTNKDCADDLNRSIFGEE